MIRYVRSIMMLAMLGLLANTAAVYGECAWVLWWEESLSGFSYRTAEANIPGGNYDHYEGETWNILGAYTTETACEAARETKIDQMLKDWRKEQANSKVGKYTIQHNPGSNIISRDIDLTGAYTSNASRRLRYLCLPDTIDPRTIKGK